MEMPVFKIPSRPLNKTGIFGGIGTDGLADAVNLVCAEKCHPRNQRKAVMLLGEEPDQIIPCENRLFFRFGNLLKEIILNEDGTLEESDTAYTLKNLSPAPDRKLIIWEDGLYVFPDDIRVGTDTWLPFAKDYSSSVAFPFINPRTLFYPNGYASEVYFEGATFLKVGMRLRFSWATSKVFTIKTIEPKRILYEDGYIEEGLRITLDANVPAYNAIPTDATAEYTDPQNRPILNDLMVGYNHKISFSGQAIAVYSNDLDYYFSFKDYFRKGQLVKISGSSIAHNNITARILTVNDTTLHFDCELSSVTEANKKVITITPIIPDFSHFLLTEDRLFGIENSTGKFYISALKNPFLFYDFPELPEDSWSVKMNGIANGIALWKDCIICFTEDGGFRILGYHALNFGLRQLSLNGIKNGCSNSLVRVGDTLYYYSEKGVMKYSGGSDKKISNANLQISDIRSTVTDGSFVYMLSNNRIWVYDTEMERWWSEDALNITAIFKFGGQKYLLSPEAVYLEKDEISDICSWSFELPLLKSTDSKKIIPLYFVLDYLSDTNCEINLYSRFFGDNNRKHCGSYNLKNEGTVKIPIPKNHCNGLEIKAEGKGAFYPDCWSVFYKKV